MTEETPTLLPCPFCGGDRIKMERPKCGSGGTTDYKCYHALCLSCGARSYEFSDSEKDAAKHWNTRVTSEQPENAIEGLIYKLFQDHRERMEEHLKWMIQFEHDRDDSNESSRDEIYLKNKRMSIYGALEEIDSLQIAFSNMMKWKTDENL